MKILWSVNIITEYPAKKLGISSSPMGGWIMSMAKSLIQNYDNIKLCLVSIYNLDNIFCCDDGDILYYVIPLKQSSEMSWKHIISDFKPDVVHIHGTELGFSLPLLNHISDYKTVVSIQGLVGELAKYYYGGISDKDRIINTTLRDMIRTTMRQEKKDFEKRGINEVNILKKTDYIVGRTDWDLSVCQKYGMEGKYRKCNENLRSVFYENEWDYSKMTPHTIFLSQGAVPYKGAHFVIEALSIVKKKYPDAQLRIAGYNIMSTTHGKNRIKEHGYTKYICKLIKKYNLQDSVEYIGLLDEQRMLREYLNAHCFVQSSLIENSPNSLGEAMLLGTPVVASFVGGTGSFLKHNVNGFAYPYNDVSLLAYYINELFENEDLCKRFSKSSKKGALTYYDRKRNAESMMCVYREAKNNQ